MEHKNLTPRTGAPVPDNQNIITAGKRGAALLQDACFLEKMAHFDRVVIPEKQMHAKGSGAYGTFTVTPETGQFSKMPLSFLPS
jgi:catalase